MRNLKKKKFIEEQIRAQRLKELREEQARQAEEARQAHLHNKLQKKFTKKRKGILIGVAMFTLLLVVYRPVMIRLTVKAYLNRNHIQDFEIQSVEPFPGAHGYLVHIRNKDQLERSLTVISKMWPIEVSYDSQLAKEDMVSKKQSGK